MGSYSHKNRLQEIMQGARRRLPEYESVSTGAPHDPVWTSFVTLTDSSGGKRKFGPGKGDSKRRAEQHAAEQALSWLDGRRGQSAKKPAAAPIAAALAQLDIGGAPGPSEPVAAHSGRGRKPVESSVEDVERLVFLDVENVSQAERWEPAVNTIPLPHVVYAVDSAGTNLSDKLRIPGHWSRLRAPSHLRDAADLLIVWEIARVAHQNFRNTIEVYVISGDDMFETLHAMASQLLPLVRFFILKGV